jgi:hypothetical protein
VGERSFLNAVRGDDHLGTSITQRSVMISALGAQAPVSPLWLKV